MKILINTCYGGFGFSEAAQQAFLNAKGLSPDYFFNVFDEDLRDDEVMINLYEAKGSEWLSKDYSRLALAEIPDGADYYIFEYDGWETLVWSDTQIHGAKFV